MNLQAITARYVATINPSETITISPSTGYATNADGGRVPAYGTPVSVKAQIQAQSYNDLQQTSGLNIQGIKEVAYLPGSWNGVVRADQKGGDLITRADGTHWLVTNVLENWGGSTGWVKVLITRQDP